MNILFDNDTNFILTENLTSLINKCALETLNFENFSTNVEISFSIVSSQEIKEINKNYRNIDKETDVLSFPLLEDFSNIINNNLHPIILGDIIVSIDKAIKQAEEYGHSLERELCFLAVHSMLHLLGYDHMVAEEEKIMFEKQNTILENLKITR